MLILISLVSLNRNLIYIKKRIGETGDPCGMPVFIAVFSDFSPSKANWIYLLFIKDYRKPSNGPSKLITKQIDSFITYITLFKKTR